MSKRGGDIEIETATKQQRDTCRIYSVALFVPSQFHFFTYSRLLLWWIG